VSALSSVVFREPEGRRTGAVLALLAAGCLLAGSYVAVVRDGPWFLLVLGVAVGCTGLAESLPADRRRSAGPLRLVALAVLVAVLGLLVSAPDAVVG
jgi:hypothetical protein